MPSENPVIVWFRQDLRLADNPALAAAVASGRPILAVYVLDEVSPDIRAHGGASRWWLHHSLESLTSDLRDLGLRLVLRRGAAADVLRELVAASGAGRPSVLNWDCTAASGEVMGPPLGAVMVAYMSVFPWPTVESRELYAVPCRPCTTR